MIEIPIAYVQLGVGLLNLIMALITLGVAARFWFRHRREGLSIGWWMLALSFGAFAISQTLEFRRLALAADHFEPGNLEITARFVFMCIMVMGISRLFDEALAAHRKSLEDAQRTIQLQADAMRQSHEMQLLYTVSHSAGSTLDLETVLKELCGSTRKMMRADSVSVRLIKPLAGGLQYAEDISAAVEATGDTLDPRVEALCQSVAQSGKPAILNDVHAHPMFGAQWQGWVQSLGAFPLRHGAEVIGVLTVVYGASCALTADEGRFVTALADQTSVAVRNAQLHEQTEQQAATDSLTGLANRRRFNEALIDEIRRARRYQSPASLVLFDLDKFKQLNDERGHLAGDAYLQGFARLLKQQSRETDVVARLGGDEFAIIMPNTTPAAAQQFAERMKIVAAQYELEWEGMAIRLQTSVGIAGWEAGITSSFDELVGAADKALYTDKGASKTPIVDHTPAAERK